MINMNEVALIAIIVSGIMIVWGALKEIKHYTGTQLPKASQMDVLKIRLEIEQTKLAQEVEKKERAKITLQIEREKTKRRKIECQEKATTKSTSEMRQQKK